MENSDKQAILSWPGSLFLPAAPCVQAWDELDLGALEGRRGEEAVPFNRRQAGAAAAGSGVRGNVSIQEKHPKLMSSFPTGRTSSDAVSWSPSASICISIWGRGGGWSSRQEECRRQEFKLWMYPSERSKLCPSSRGHAEQEQSCSHPPRPARVPPQCHGQGGLCCREPPHRLPTLAPASLFPGSAFPALWLASLLLCSLARAASLAPYSSSTALLGSLQDSCVSPHSRRWVPDTRLHDLL